MPHETDIRHQARRFFLRNLNQKYSSSSTKKPYLNIRYEQDDPSSSFIRLLCVKTVISAARTKEF